MTLLDILYIVAILWLLNGALTHAFTKKSLQYFIVGAAWLAMLAIVILVLVRFGVIHVGWFHV